MCTALSYNASDFYFGRTLDYDRSYGEEIVIMPRCFELNFLHTESSKKHYAIIGTAHIENNYPLFYDAANEKGLAMAGLNFVGNAHYHDIIANKINIAQFEFIPYILSQCANVCEAEKLLQNLNLTGDSFNKNLPASSLHWIISDKEKSIVIESVQSGIYIYSNPIGILTNNPPFSSQLFKLNDYMHLSNTQPENTFSDKLKLFPYSRGMGALGLPGDWSSSSRFIKTAFTTLNSIPGNSEPSNVNQFFHILSGVSQPRGCCKTNAGYEITLYTVCYSTSKGIYYYTTYNNHQISAVKLYNENLDENILKRFSMINEEQINMIN